MFDGLDLVVGPGDVTGLVGANGAGKSTLLRVLAGLEQPEHGSLALNPPAATVGHLPQEPERRPGETVGDFLARRTGVTDAEAAMDAAALALAEGGEGEGEVYSAALERWLALGGADFAERAREIASDIGLKVDLDAPMYTSLIAAPSCPDCLAARERIRSVIHRVAAYVITNPTRTHSAADLPVSTR